MRGRTTTSKLEGKEGRGGRGATATATATATAAAAAATVTVTAAKAITAEARTAAITTTSATAIANSNSNNSTNSNSKQQQQTAAAAAATAAAAAITGAAAVNRSSSSKENNLATPWSSQVGPPTCSDPKVGPPTCIDPRVCQYSHESAPLPPRENWRSLVQPVSPDQESLHPLIDTQLADQAVLALRELAETGDSFFLALGFRKPHVPLTFPDRMLEHYQERAED